MCLRIPLKIPEREMVSQRISHFLSLWYIRPDSRLPKGHVEAFGDVGSLTNVYLVLHDFLYYVTG